MRAARRDAARRNRWLITAASAVLLVGCGGPYAWNEYIDPAYAGGTNAIASASGVPAQVGGTVGNISADELRSIVAEGTQAPAAVPAGAAPQQGSSAPEDPATRTVWTFSSTPAPGGAGTNVHVKATYYRDNAIFSIAEGDTVITSGDDPRLRQIVADVTSALVPRVRRGGPGRG